MDVDDYLIGEINFNKTIDVDEVLCNHKFKVKDQYEISSNTYRIKIECSKCKAKFEGVVFKK